MKLDEFLAEMSDLHVYGSDDWNDYLDCFEDADHLRASITGTSSRHCGELSRRIRGGAVHIDASLDAPCPPKITTIENLAAHSSQNNIALGVVSGCFDLLHLSHLHAIRTAKESIDQGLCAELCALVLSDQDIKAKKGVARPVMTIGERLRLLAAVRFIDHVAPLPTPDCLTALAQLRPRWYFKSRADLCQEIVRREIDLMTSLGGEVRFLPDSSAVRYSTTALIEMIRNARARPSVTPERTFRMRGFH